MKATWWRPTTASDISVGDLICAQRVRGELVVEVQGRVARVHLSRFPVVYLHNSESPDIPYGIQALYYDIWKIGE